jgi:hypothetical protein
MTCEQGWVFGGAAGIFIDLAISRSFEAHFLKVLIDITGI